MLPMYYATAWYGEKISKPIRGEWRKAVAPGKSHFLGGMVTGATLLAHVPQVAMGAAPYLTAARISQNAAKAAHVLEIYNYKGWAKAEYMLKPANILKAFFLGGALPSKAQAKAAAKTVKFASRAVPIIGAVALAHDIYDVVFNRSLWGFQFGNPTPGDRWWN